MTAPQHPHAKGILLSIAGFSLFSLGDAAYKYLSPHYPAMVMLFFASLCVVLCLLALSPKLGGLKRTFKSPNLKFHLLRGIVMFLQGYTFIWAIGFMPMAKAYALVFIAPFITALLGVLWLRDHIGTRQLLAIAGGFTGVLIVLRPGMVPLELPSLVMLLSAALFSMLSISARWIARRGANDPMLVWGLLPELVVLCCASLIAAPVLTMPEPFHLALLFFIGATSAAGTICMALAFIAAPPAIAAPFHYIQMLWAVALGYLLFGDTLDVWTALGSTIIIASGIWLVRQSKS